MSDKTKPDEGNLTIEFAPLPGHPAPNAVARMLIVPFVAGTCVLIRHESGEISIPAWRTGTGRNYLHGAYLAPLAQAGVRLQQFHPFAVHTKDPNFIVGWVDGQLRETDSDRIVAPPEKAQMLLREQENNELATLVQWAADSYGSQSDQSYYQDVHLLLEESFLAAETVFGGSGFGGDAARWRTARGLIATAIHKDGTFLDIGCANGLLMESVVSWAAERGLRIEPYGMDISARLAAVARERLPQWADRIYVGNVMFWQPPRRFDFVSTDLGYVPEPRRPALVQRLLREFVAPGGRLIVTSYGLTDDPGRVDWSVGEHLRFLGIEPDGEPEKLDPITGRQYRIAYIDAG